MRWWSTLLMVAACAPVGTRPGGVCSAVAPESNPALVAAAKYLSDMHNRLHPIFGEAFLQSLDKLPPSHPANQQDLSMMLELALDGAGDIVGLVPSHLSGSFVFDQGAIESIRSAAPFGPPPARMLFPDGRAYLAWEFHRNPWYACSTYFARPYFPASAWHPSRKIQEQGAPTSLPPAPSKAAN